MIDIYHNGLLAKDAPKLSKIKDLRVLYAAEADYNEKCLKTAMNGAARIADFFSSANESRNTLDDLLKRIEKDKSDENLIDTAFSMFFEYEISARLYGQIGNEKFSEEVEKNTNRSDAMKDAFRLLAYGEQGSCDKCKTPFDIGGMWAKGIWRSSDCLAFKNPKSAKLEFWAYCECHTNGCSKTIIAPKKYQTDYFNKFVQLKKKIEQLNSSKKK